MTKDRPVDRTLHGIYSVVGDIFEIAELARPIACFKLAGYVSGNGITVCAPDSKYRDLLNVWFEIAGVTQLVAHGLKSSHERSHRHVARNVGRPVTNA
jgi:hypothetical protein